MPEAAAVEVGDWPTWGALLLSAVSLIWQGVNQWRSKGISQKGYQVARIESLESQVAEIRSLAMAYWLAPEDKSSRDSVMLVHHLRELSVSASRYSSFLWHGAGTDVLRLKIATTGGKFQQADREQLTSDSAIVKEFIAVAADLSRRLRDLRDQIEKP